jgi:hypothetical protein
MATLNQENKSKIIASLMSIPCEEYHIDNYFKKISGLPLREIEVDLDTLEEIGRFKTLDNFLITAMINYPLSGYQPEFILNCIRWVVNRKADMICTGLPSSWLRSEMVDKLSRLLDTIKKICQKKPLRVSIESSLMSIDELLIICNLLTEAGIPHIKTSSGLPHPTMQEKLLFIRSNFPDLILTVDNNLRGDSPEIDNLFQLGADYVCITEPWLYHF